MSNDPAIQPVGSFGAGGPLLLRPTRHGDARGWFVERFSDARFRAEVSDTGFAQDNRSFSARVGTVRGLHFQRAPFAQGKLIDVAAGAIFDAMVDLREGSSTYGQSAHVTIDAASGAQVWIPAGFAHGFCTVQPDTIVDYKVTARYAPETEGGLRWDDPKLGIPWPECADPATLTEKDRRWPGLADVAPMTADA